MIPVSDLKEFCSKSELFQESFDKGDLEPIKMELDKYPDFFDATHCSATKTAFKLFLIRNFSHPTNFIDSFKREEPDLINKNFEMVLYIAKREDVDLFNQEIGYFGSYNNQNFSYRKHTKRKKFFQYLEMFRGLLSEPKVKEIVLAIIERTEFKALSDDNIFQKFLKNERYILDASSKKIFNINYRDQYGKTISHYLFPYYMFDEVLAFLKRKDIDMGILDNSGETAFTSKINEHDNGVIYIRRRCNYFRRLIQLDKVIDLLKKSNIDFSIGNLSLYSLTFHIYTRIMRDSWDVSHYMKAKKLAVHPLVILLRNNENKISMNIAKNLMRETNAFEALNLEEEIKAIKSMERGKRTTPKRENRFITLVNYPDCDGNTLLHLAAEYGFLEEARFLLERGAKADIFNNDGYNALHLAAFNGELNQYRDLITLNDHSPNPFLQKNKFGESPEEIQKYILENPEKEIIKTYENMDSKTIRFLLRFSKKYLRKYKEELKEKKDLELRDQLKQQETEKRQKLEKPLKLEKPVRLETRHELENSKESEKLAELETQQELEKPQESQRPAKLETQQELEKPQELRKPQESYFKKYTSLISRTIKNIFLKISKFLKNFFTMFKTKPIFDVADSKSAKTPLQITKVLNLNSEPPSREESVFILQPEYLEPNRVLPDFAPILNVVDLKGNTILHGLLIENETTTERLNKEVSDPKEREDQIKKNHEELAVIIQDFVECGFDATKKNANGDTALHLAARTGDTILFAAFSRVKKDGDGVKIKKDPDKNISSGVTINSDIFLVLNKAGKTPLNIISSVLGSRLKEAANKHEAVEKAQKSRLDKIRVQRSAQKAGNVKIRENTII